jgi:hypothetical protein
VYTEDHPTSLVLKFHHFSPHPVEADFVRFLTFQLWRREMGANRQGLPKVLEHGVPADNTTLRLNEAARTFRAHLPIRRNGQSMPVTVYGHIEDVLESDRKRQRYFLGVPAEEALQLFVGPDGRTPVFTEGFDKAELWPYDDATEQPLTERRLAAWIQAARKGEPIVIADPQRFREERASWGKIQQRYAQAEVDYEVLLERRGLVASAPGDNVVPLRPRTGGAVDDLFWDDLPKLSASSEYDDETAMMPPGMRQEIIERNRQFELDIRWTRVQQQAQDAHSRNH